MSNFVNLRKWSENRPYHITTLAEFIASSAPFIFDFIKFNNESSHSNVFSNSIPAKDWLDLYKNHRQVIRIVHSDFKSFGGIAELGANAFEFLFPGKLQNISTKQIHTIKEFITYFSSLDQDEQKKLLSDSNEEWETIYAFHHQELDFDYNDKIDEETRKRYRRIFNKPEWIFFLKIFARSYLFYGRHPSFILRKARLGNKEALERILSLDGSILGDKKIFEYYHQSVHGKSVISKDEIIKAIQSDPKGIRTLQTLKYRIAGFISIVSEFFGQRLNSMEIEELFTALANDLNIDDLVLNENPEVNDKSISERIRRERKFWILILTPNKKN